MFRRTFVKPAILQKRKTGRVILQTRRRPEGLISMRYKSLVMQIESLANLNSFHKPIPSE